MTPVDIDKLKEQIARVIAPERWEMHLWAAAHSKTPFNVDGLLAKADDIIDLFAALIAKAERVDAMTEALEPFARIGTLCGDKNATVIGFGPDDFVTYEHFRAARNALSPKPEDAAS